MKVEDNRVTSLSPLPRHRYICTLKSTNRFWKEPCWSLKPFFTCNFVQPLKTCFSANFSFSLLAEGPVQISATIAWFVENREACSLPSALWLTFSHVSYTWLVCSLDHKLKGKGMYRSSILSSRFWGEALRDDTKNDCVKDKPTTNSFLISVFMILKKKTTNKLSQS